MYKLSSKQTKAATLLASGMTAVEVAKAVGRTPETISAWKNHNPKFQVLVNQLNKETVDVMQRAMWDLGSEAVATIGDLLKTDPKKRASKLSGWRLRISRRIHRAEARISRPLSRSL